jgi:addiction module HigA family antidote
MKSYPMRGCSDYEVPPGDLICETAEHYELSRHEIAKRLGMTTNSYAKLLRGGIAITSELASSLERALGIGAHVWLGLQKDYDAAKKINRERAAKKRKKWWRR